MARADSDASLIGRTNVNPPSPDQAAVDTSHEALVSVLERLKTAVDPEEINELTRQAERIVFHKQFMNA